MAVDRTPKVGYTLLVAFGDAEPGVADEVTVGLDGVTVESDEEI